MTDASGAADTLPSGESTAQPQAGTSSSGQAPGGTAKADTAAASGTDDVALLRSQLEELRRESAAHRKERQRLEAEAKAAADAKLPEQERIAKELADLRAENESLRTSTQSAALRVAAVEVATRLGFRSPELAYRLLDSAQVEWREDGQPKNVEHLLNDVLKRDPYLGKPSPDLGGGPRGGTPSRDVSMNDLIRAAMKPG